MSNPNIQVISNLKLIKTGVVPTALTLPIGSMGFGKIAADGKYHLFGNSDGVVKDYVLEMLQGVAANMTLQDVLDNGNIADDIQMKLTGTGGFDVIMSAITGFTDGGKPVLSANPDRTITAGDALTMRNALAIYSKTEVDGLLSSVFRFKGNVATVATLPTDASVGDAYQVDGNGKIYAWDGDEWTMLSAIIDLTEYYTKSEVDTIVSAAATSNTTVISELKTEITTEIAALETDLESQINDVDTKADTALAMNLQAVVTNGVTLDAASATAVRNSIDVYNIAEVDALIPTVADLNVYTKTETYTKAEVNALIPTVTFVIDEI